jgi:DNA-directed RNA polymerase subunit RPC12/RpoP
MRCPECGHTAVPGALFCEACGADLAEPAGADETSPGDEAAAVACPECGHANPADFVVCEACGHRLRDDAATPEPAPEPAPEAVPAAAADAAEPVPERRLEPAVPEPRPVPPPRPVETSGQLVTGPKKGRVKLVVEQGLVVGKQFLLTADEMLVGRSDPAESIYPDLDLSGLDEGYVHRRHAVLAFDGSFLFVTHLGGRNGTFVNNRPIADHLAHPLNVGDTVRFGKVVMRLSEA